MRQHLLIWGIRVFLYSLKYIGQFSSGSQICLKYIGRYSLGIVYRNAKSRQDTSYLVRFEKLWSAERGVPQQILLV